MPGHTAKERLALRAGGQRTIRKDKKRKDFPVRDASALGRLATAFKSQSKIPIVRREKK